MEQGLMRCRAAWPGRPIRIAAQQRLEAFYVSLAFRTVSPPYIEDGIVHVDMMLETRS
jgi:ElaA protein